MAIKSALLFLSGLQRMAIVMGMDECRMLIRMCSKLCLGCKLRLSSSERVWLLLIWSCEEIGGDFLRARARGSR